MKGIVKFNSTPSIKEFGEKLLAEMQRRAEKKDLDWLTEVYFTLPKLARMIDGVVTNQGKFKIEESEESPEYKTIYLLMVDLFGEKAKSKYHSYETKKRVVPEQTEEQKVLLEKDAEELFAKVFYREDDKPMIREDAFLPANTLDNVVLNVEAGVKVNAGNPERKIELQGWVNLINEYFKNSPESKYFSFNERDVVTPFQTEEQKQKLFSKIGLEIKDIKNETNTN